MWAGGALAGVALAALAALPAAAQQVVAMPRPAGAPAAVTPQVVSLPRADAAQRVNANIERWAAHIREAAERFGVPESWIREVMRMESGGNPLAISSAGAMGLMQVIPSTYAMLRWQHGLGPNAFDPRDNILAGAAYIREMYDLYGFPGFLAAYNAGPRRVDGFMAGQALPAETVNYLAVLGPRLSGTTVAEGPLAGFTRGLAGAPAEGPLAINIAAALAGDQGAGLFTLTQTGVRVAAPPREATGLVPRGMLGAPQLVAMPKPDGRPAEPLPLPAWMVAQLTRAPRR